MPDSIGQAVKDIVGNQEGDDPRHQPGGNRYHSQAFHAKQHIDDSPDAGKRQPLCTQPQPFLSIHSAALTFLAIDKTP